MKCVSYTVVLIGLPTSSTSSDSSENEGESTEVVAALSITVTLLVPCQSVWPLVASLCGVL